MSEKTYSVPLLNDENSSDINRFEYNRNTEKITPDKLISTYFHELQRYGLTEKKISIMTGLTISTISQIFSGKRHPSLYSLTAICVCMRLYPPKSFLLMKKFKLILDDDDPKDRICLKYLYGCGFNMDFTVESCNRELYENGFEKLK